MTGVKNPITKPQPKEDYHSLRLNAFIENLVKNDNFDVDDVKKNETEENKIKPRKHLKKPECQSEIIQDSKQINDEKMKEKQDDRFF